MLAADTLAGRRRRHGQIEQPQAPRRAPSYPSVGAKLLFSPPYSPEYQQHVAAGKPTKIAITPTMQKLVVTADALLEADRCWA